MAIYINSRTSFGVFFVICLIATLLHGYYFQFPPCPICELQTITGGLLAIIALCAFVHKPKPLGTITYSTIFCIISIIGFSLATQQMSLLTTASQNQFCSLGLLYLLQTLPWQQALDRALTDPGCVNLNWKFLSLHIIYWRKIFFISMCLLSVLKAVLALITLKQQQKNA